MLRIDAKQLIENDGLYYHRGILFTGIAFFLNTPLIEKVNEYSQGKLIGPYTSKWLDNDKSILKVEIDELDGDGELQQALFEGSPFTGIGYDIDGGVCHQESDYENGWICQEIDFYKNGEVGYINLKNQTLSEEVRYNNKGDIEEYQLNKFNNFNIELFYTEQALRTVRLNGDFFGRIHQDEYLLGIDVPDTLVKIKELVISPRLCLFGSGINDELVKAIIYNKTLGNTNSIIISGTSLSLGTIEDLIYNTKLTELRIRDKRTDIMLQLPCSLKKYKAEKSQCDIELNNEKII
tara:strand:+ start:7752 stop:8630 length:879 start_codon:yes stop_codon:yes gene_type:complete